MKGRTRKNVERRNISVNVEVGALLDEYSAMRRAERSQVISIALCEYFMFGRDSEFAKRAAKVLREISPGDTVETDDRVISV